MQEHGYLKTPCIWQLILQTFLLIIFYHIVHKANEKFTTVLGAYASQTAIPLHDQQRNYKSRLYWESAHFYIKVGFTID